MSKKNYDELFIATKLDVEGAGTFFYNNVAVTATAAELNIMDGVTATAAELNGSADVSGRYVDIGDNTSYTVLVADSGKTHSWPDLTSALTITLPAAAAGLEYKFVYAGVVADAVACIIDCTGFYLGGVTHIDIDGSTTATVAGNGSSNDIFTMVTPEPGTEVTVICDGTNWIISGQVADDSVCTFGD